MKRLQGFKVRFRHPVKEKERPDLDAKDFRIRHLHQLLYAGMPFEQSIPDQRFLGVIGEFLVYSGYCQRLGIGVLLPCIDQQADRGIRRQVPEFFAVATGDHVDFTALCVWYIGHKRTMGSIMQNGRFPRQKTVRLEKRPSR